jgi:opacity protein-like surface antigen
MMKKLLIGAGLLASVAAMAADVAPAEAAQVRAGDKKSQALQCQQQATEKKLEGAEKKSFLVKCLNPAAAKVVPAK